MGSLIKLTFALVLAAVPVGLFAWAPAHAETPIHQAWEVG